MGKQTEDRGCLIEHSPMFTPTIWSQGQGCGYKSNTMDTSLIGLEALPAALLPGTIQPGQMTDLFGFFNKPINYHGIREEIEMVFYLGSSADLFGLTYYWQRMILASPTRAYSACTAQTPAGIGIWLTGS